MFNKTVSVKNKNVLVTGGTGFIGSHTLVELINSGYRPFVVDNGINSKPKLVIQRVKDITGVDVLHKIIEIGDVGAMRRFIAEMKTDGINFQTVIHFAALKAVGESVLEPLMYFQNNIAGTLALLAVIKEVQIPEFVFSSSATVYGLPKSVPINENAETVRPNSPYGETKLMMEWALQSFAKANPWFNLTLLRYFNPIGAHPSGLLGEDPQGIPNNLFPIMMQIANGRYKLPYLAVAGNDYLTNKNGYKIDPNGDNTCVRDYLHVEDLARAHVLAMGKPGIFNLGSGNGTTVLEMFHAFNRALEKAGHAPITMKLEGRRPGDVPELLADASKAERELLWTPKHKIYETCEHGVTFALNNPRGYE